MRLLVTSFRGGSNDEAHRFFHSRDQFLDPLLGRAAESQPEYRQGIPGRVYFASAILSRLPGNRSGKTASRTGRRFVGRSLPGSLGERKEVRAQYAEPSPCRLARVLPICSGGRTGPYAPVSEDPRHPVAATYSSYSRISFQRGVGRDSGTAESPNPTGSKKRGFAQHTLRQRRAGSGIDRSFSRRCSVGSTCAVASSGKGAQDAYCSLNGQHSLAPARPYPGQPLRSAGRIRQTSFSEPAQSTTVAIWNPLYPSAVSRQCTK